MSASMPTVDMDLRLAVETINLARDRAETDRERDLVSHAADMVFWARKVGQSRRLIVALVAIAEIAKRPAPKTLTSVEVDSSSIPGVRYTVSRLSAEAPWSCTCPGWRHRKRCRHIDSVVRSERIKAAS